MVSLDTTRLGNLGTSDEFNFQWVTNDEGQMNSKAIRLFDREKVNKVVTDVMSESLKKIKAE